MATMFYDKDADIDLIRGAEGRCDRVWLAGARARAESPGQRHRRRRRAAGGQQVCGEGHGRRTQGAVASPRPRKWADVIMVLIPDQHQAKVYKADIEPHLTPGKMLMFAHGFAIRFNWIVPPKDVDVTMVAPKAPGHRVREVFKEGAGTPGLLAVHQDVTGKGRATALAYARGIGCTRAGVIETTFAEETETDLFGEQAVLCGGTSALVKAGVRNAGRGRLSAGDRLLRVPARAEADRRSDVSRRPAVHALLDQRHGRVRRLHRRLAHRHRPRRRRR